MFKKVVINYYQSLLSICTYKKTYVCIGYAHVRFLYLLHHGEMTIVECILQIFVYFLSPIGTVHWTEGSDAKGSSSFYIMLTIINKQHSVGC